MRFIISIILFSLLSIKLHAQVLPSYVPKNGLIAWYPLDGDANDRSGNNLNGIVNGASLTVDRFGFSNQAYLFDGIDDFIDCGANNLFNFQSSDFTISCWVATAPANRSGCVLSKCTIGSENSYYLMDAENGVKGTNNYAWFAMKNANSADGGNCASPCSYPYYHNINSGGNIKKNSWVHLVVIRDSKNRHLFYRDGLLQTSFTPTVRIMQKNNSNFFIGRLGTSSQERFLGKIDDIGIWNRALTDSEVAALFSVKGQLSNTDINSNNYANNSSTSEPQFIPEDDKGLQENGQISKIEVANQKSEKAILDSLGNQIIKVMEKAKAYNMPGVIVVANNHYGLIDFSGKIILPIKYQRISILSNGLIQTMVNNRYGLFDIRGNVLAPVVYDEIDDFKDSVALVKINGKWGLLNKSGRVQVTPKYDDRFTFQSGVADVKMNGVQIKIDTCGMRVENKFWKYSLREVYRRSILWGANYQPSIYDHARSGIDQIFNEINRHTVGRRSDWVVLNSKGFKTYIWINKLEKVLLGSSLAKKDINDEIIFTISTKTNALKSEVKALLGGGNLTNLQQSEWNEILKSAIVVFKSNVIYSMEVSKEYDAAMKKTVRTPPAPPPPPPPPSVAEVKPCGNCNRKDYEFTIRDKNGYPKSVKMRNPGYERCRTCNLGTIYGSGGSIKSCYINRCEGGWIKCSNYCRSGYER
jgi:hypothetical protein